MRYSNDIQDIMVVGGDVAATAAATDGDLSRWEYLTQNFDRDDCFVDKTTVPTTTTPPMQFQLPSTLVEAESFSSSDDSLSVSGGGGAFYYKLQQQTQQPQMNAEMVAPIVMMNNNLAPTPAAAAGAAAAPVNLFPSYITTLAPQTSSCNFVQPSLTDLASFMMAVSSSTAATPSCAAPAGYPSYSFPMPSVVTTQPEVPYTTTLQTPLQQQQQQPQCGNYFPVQFESMTGPPSWPNAPYCENLDDWMALEPTPIEPIQSSCSNNASAGMGAINFLSGLYNLDGTNGMADMASSTDQCVKEDFRLAASVGPPKTRRKPSASTSRSKQQRVVRDDRASSPVTTTGAATSAMMPQPLKVTKMCVPLTAYNYFYRNERDNIVRGTKRPGDPLPRPDHDFSPSKHEELLYQHWFVDPYKGKRDHRMTHGRIDFRTLTKVIAQRWKQLPAEGRAFYRGVAQADQDEYDRYAPPEERQRSRSSIVSVDTTTTSTTDESVEKLELEKSNDEAIADEEDDGTEF